MPLILNQLLHSERIDQHQSIVPKQTGQTLTLNIVSSPVLPSSSCQNVLVGSPGKSKNAGKYICKHCGRDCLKPSVLEKHIRSHTGERPFPCTTCGIAFKTQSNLYKHRRTQTHVNNTRLPSESDNSGILEENEKATDIMSHQGAKRDNICEKQRSGNKEISSEMSTAVDTKNFSSIILLPPLNTLSLTSESQRITIGDSNWPDTSQGVTEREPVQDTPNLSSPVILAESLHQRRKMQEQRFSTTNKHIQLQRQQATYSDRQWDCKPSDYKLKKCESTDSGYLSRSDSTEQQILTSSPLHSLCEQSTELEKETAFSGLRCTAGSSAKPESAEKATALMLEKKKLEEHISKLISHNKAVVDDTQLDNVRPRKTVLSKQGSIDLPMPYTYKDSFHFDIKSLDVNRKKNLALCSAKSTFTPIEKSKPLFFHSVPTQFSTTIDCVPVTRSNSLPFVESTRMAHDRVGSSKVPSLTRQPLNTGSSSLLHSNNLATSSVDFPNSHPRALVRQTAVDDLPLSNTVSYYSTSEETKDTKKPEAGGEVVNAKSKKSTQRKFKMFSQEKWQMYGDETFKKIYQKMKSSQTSKKLNQSGKKDTDNIDFTPDSKEAASGDGVPQPKDVRSSLSGNLSSPSTICATELNTVESKNCPIGNQILHSVSSEEKAGRFTELMETAHSVNAEISVISKTSPKHDCSNKHSSDKYIGGKNTLLALSSHEMRFQLKQRASQLNTNMLHADSLQMHNNQFEESCPGRESNTPVSECENILKSDRENHSSKETSQHAQMPLRVHNSSTGESTQVFQKLPSERKKLKVEELNSSNNPALKLSPRPCSENNAVGETVKLTDCNSVNAASAALVQQSLKGEQNLNSYLNDSIGCAKSMEYEKTLKPHIGPIYSNDNSANLLLQSAKVSMASLSECLVPELERGNCSSSALDKVTATEAKTCPVTVGARVSLHSGDDVGMSSTIQNLEFGLVTSPLKKSAFSPKYILKLPQEENTTDLPLLMRPGPESMPVISLPVPLTKASYTINSRSVSTDSSDVFLSPLEFELRHQTRAVGLSWGVHTNWKALLPCSPINSTIINISTKTGDIFQNQSCRHKEITKDAWKDTEDKDNLSSQMQADKKWISTTVCSAQTTGKKVRFSSMCTGGFFISSDIKGENQVLRHLHSENNSLIMTSSSGKGATSSGDTEQKIMGWDTDGSSSSILKDISPGLQDLQYSVCSKDKSNYFCHSFGTLYCHALGSQHKELPALSQVSVTCLSGNARILSTKGSFPSLNAEPQLTWCCLTRSLPLPAEQKEKADSAYSSLHICKKNSGSERTLSKCDFSFIKTKNINKTVTCGLTTGNLKTLVSSFSQEEQPQKKPVVHITRMASKEFKKHMINPYIGRSKKLEQLNSLYFESFCQELMKIMGWDTDGSSSSILKDISPGLQDLQYSVCSKDKSNYFCHSFGTLYCHALGSQHKELPALSQVSVTCLSGNARILSTKGSFPSLNAEPQLTWCCLTRSLPLPAEQKEKADSAYSSLHICKKNSGSERTLSKCDFSFIKTKNINKTVTCGLTTGNLKTLVSSFSQEEQPQKQSSSKAGGCGVLENVSEREKKERLYRREKFTTNKSKRSHKQKKMKINPKWSKGNHVHGYTQLKTKRLSKQHWLPNRALDTLKKHLPYHSRDSLNQCEKSYSPASNLQDNYHPQQGEFSCPTSDKPVSKGNNDKKEDKNHKNNSGIFSLAEHSSNFRQKGKLDGKDITTPNYKPSRGNLSLQNISAMPGLPMVTYSCSSPAKAATEQTNNDLDICCLVTQPLTLQKPFPVEPQPNVYSDPVESSFWSFPFDFIGTGTCCQHVSMGSEVTAPFFVWPKADHKNILNVESQSQSFAAAYPLVQTSGKEEHPMEGNSYSSLKGKLIPSSKTVCSASLGSKVNTLPQTSITSTSLPSTANIQGMNTSHDPHECVNKNGAYLQSDGQGKLNETGTNTFKEPSFPSSPTESTASSETPSRTYKKRGLERMRKQTRVEYDDTSSDDEDRLVIEI
nr:zinc finger protein 831 [Pelodiscus sinensis]|eukprot:XP_025046267.1 zinc finger protein 831 [Pelodiscus sinensis]